MNDHYYTRNPASESRPVECEYTYRGIPLVFRTDAGVFSRGEVDAGTDLLLKSLPEEISGDILDLGCGWGVIGTCVARRWPETRVTMADVNLRALELSRENAKRNRAEVRCLESDGMEAVKGERFDMVITNPPIRAGKQVIYRMFADAEECLRPGGSLILVIRKQQGAESCIRYLQTLFPEVEKTAKSGGFWVLKATKNERALS
ncbi:MAG: class I SAM-dependent methyltransferase [Clostridia bacterium]|nr:class I SAM-dependent methyltransferase [Clostridia bacterium]